MMHREFLLVFLFVAAVVAHRKPHAVGSVRLLKTNETVHPTGSDLEFSWAKCVICDGYDARLYLQDISGKREIPYQLKSAVTALRIRDVPPKTLYKFVVKGFPSDASESEISGRTFSPVAPLPVEELVARVLTNSSIQIEWTARNADGFFVRILERNSLVQEKRIPDFSNHTILNITNLKPETTYDVHVTAFYFPPTETSISGSSSAQVKTLPLLLPNIRMWWSSDSERKLTWANPEFPVPVAHKLVCMNGHETLLNARFSGSTSFVILSKIDDSLDLNCVLETWFSIDPSTGVSSRMRKLAKDRSAPPPVDTIYCRHGNEVQIETSLNYKLERVNGVELLVLSLTKTHPRHVHLIELDYKLCALNASCDDSWSTIRQAESFTLLQRRGTLEAWIPYTLFYRSYFRCENDGRQQMTQIRSLKLPVLVGAVDPVMELAATASGASWRYNSSSAPPDYFLLTHCANDDCSSESVPGEDRVVTLGKLKKNFVSYVTVQAVKLRDGRAHVSSTEMTAIPPPEEESSKNLSLTFEEIPDSPVVQLLIAHHGSAGFPPVVEYHIDVCRKLERIRNDTGLDSDRVCEPMVTTNSSIELNRQPWTSYNVSVVVCYGDFDSSEPVNLTLPIFKQAPGQLVELSWAGEKASVDWRYESLVLSGFSISICPPLNVSRAACSETMAGPSERQYHISPSEFTASGFNVSVTPFVTYEGRFFNGTRAELVVDAQDGLPLSLTE